MVTKFNPIDIAIAENSRQHLRRFAEHAGNPEGCKNTCPFYNECKNIPGHLCEIITGENLMSDIPDVDDPRQLKLFND